MFLLLYVAWIAVGLFMIDRFIYRPANAYFHLKFTFVYPTVEGWNLFDYVWGILAAHIWILIVPFIGFGIEKINLNSIGFLYLDAIKAKFGSKWNAKLRVWEY